MTGMPPRASVLFSGSEGGTAPCQVNWEETSWCVCLDLQTQSLPKRLESSQPKNKMSVHKPATKIVLFQASLCSQLWLYPTWWMSETQWALSILPWSLTSFTTTVNTWQGAAWLSTCHVLYRTNNFQCEKKVTLYMALPPLPNISLRDITTVHKNAFLSDYKLSLRLYFKHLQAKKLGFRCSAVPKSHPFPWYISGKNSAASFPFKTQCTSKNRLHPLKCYFYSIPLGFVFWFVFKPLWQLAVKDLSVMK